MVDFILDIDEEYLDSELPINIFSSKNCKLKGKLIYSKNGVICHMTTCNLDGRDVKLRIERNVMRRSNNFRNPKAYDISKTNIFSGKKRISAVFESTRHQGSRHINALSYGIGTRYADKIAYQLGLSARDNY